MTISEQQWRKQALEEDARANEATAEKSSAVGDAAAMREALESCRDFIMRLDRAFNPFMQKLLEDAITKADAALAEPVRNCDVGTADEQSSRYNKFCFAHRSCERGCGDCPLAKDPYCEFAWSQMPYTEGEVE